jgi:hypothetical protein
LELINIIKLKDDEINNNFKNLKELEQIKKENNKSLLFLENKI